jgi:hypothetical protein
MAAGTARNEVVRKEEAAAVKGWVVAAEGQVAVVKN